MLASNVMGQQRFLNTIRNQSRGYAAGQDTDGMVQGSESAESEDDQEAADPSVAAADHGPFALLLSQLRDELNNALAREHFRDAREIQNLVLIILDNLNVGNLREPHPRARILGEVASRLECMMPRQQILFPSVAERYQQLASLSRSMVEERNQSDEFSVSAAAVG